MNQQEKNKASHRVFVDYIPAEIQYRQNNEWRIVYYALDPKSQKLKRFRKRVKPLKIKKARLQYAKSMCEGINKKLQEGWSPFYDTDNAKEYTKLSKCIENYLMQNEALLKNNAIRIATHKSYRSYCRLLLAYLRDKNIENILCLQFDNKLVVNYLDYIYFTKKRTGRTANNHLGFCSILSNYMVERGYLSKNNLSKIPPMKVEKKKREIIDPETRKQLFNFLLEKDKAYLTLCLTLYYCFIRRTELSLLKVEHVKLAEGIIYIPGNISKNKKNEIVTIPKKLGAYLVDHLKDATNEMYLFSGKFFKPSYEKLAAKKISDTWTKLRSQIGFKKEYQFYSLKDTGITELFLMNVPLIKIRDQARHYDVKITETYTPRMYQKDEFLSKIDFEF